MSIGIAQEVNVKCRAMYARLLDRGEYDELLAMKNVSQIAAYLKKQTPYAYVLRRIDENDAHRGQLEQVFKRSLFYDYERLIKFMTGGNSDVLKEMFSKYEIDDLKLVIGSICSEREHYLTPEDLAYVRTYSEFPTSSLLDAKTMEELVENLSHTRYYEPLLPFAAREDPDFFKIDNALNLFNYRSKMNVFRSSLRGAARKAVESLYGMQADIENILFIYRIKKLYRFAAKEILANLIPCKCKISKKEFLDLAECEDMDGLTDRIGATKYGFLFPKDRESEWETIHAEYFYQLHRKNLHRQGDKAGVALSYLYLKEMDIRNIIMIIEGVRYSVPAEKITSYLIGYA
jgi:V/A-type H+-transporting ATPase subunit C